MMLYTLVTFGICITRARIVSATCVVSSSAAPGGSSTCSTANPTSPAGAKPFGMNGINANDATSRAVATASVLRRCPRHHSIASRYLRLIQLSSFGSACGFSMYAAIIGVSMRATSNENITATAAVKANGRKNSPGTPPMNATGTNTAHSVSVVATTARPISIAASVAASSGFLPLRRCRTMFSTSTIASSTSMPTTSDSASSVSRFSV